jgi:PAS domain S-box-containing protein
MLKEFSDKQLSNLNRIELALFLIILLLVIFQYFKITLPINKYLINKTLELEGMRDERLKELESILASTPSGLTIIDSSGNLLKINPQGLALIEADSFAEVEGSNFIDFVEETYRNKFVKFNESICLGESGELAFEAIGLKGTRYWYESFAAPYLLEDGSYAQIAIINDISEKVKAKNDFETLLKDYQNELKVSRELLTLNDEILDSTPDGVLLINHETRTVEKVNKKFFEMWNIPKELADSKDDEKLIGCVLDQLQDPQDFLSVVEELYSTPLKESFDNLSFKDNRVFERYSYPLIISEKPIGRIWLFRDVTEKREMEKMLHHSAKLASIGQLAAGVGHEINNPLAIIKLYIEKLQKQETNKEEVSKDKKLLKTLSNISIATDRISKIVLGLRTFARTEKTSDVDKFSIRGLIFEVDSMLNDIYRKEEVNLVCMTEEIQESLFFNGDRGKLQQVLIT